MIDCPNRSPNPSRASAVAVNVWLSLIGSTCWATDKTVSNNVLNSVVTDVTSITSEVLMRSFAGFFGDENDTYLLPKTVVALMLASTFFGMYLRYLGSTSSVIFALGSPPTLTSLISATRPISTPLYVTFAPGSIDRPDRAEIIVSRSRGRKSPRNWKYTSTIAAMVINANTNPASLYGGVRGELIGAVISYTVRLKFGSTP